jgi:hypothetical protein
MNAKAKCPGVDGKKCGVRVTASCTGDPKRCRQCCRKANVECSKHKTQAQLPDSESAGVKVCDSLAARSDVTSSVVLCESETQGSL